jgi:RHS repeat-associated protein
MGRRFSKTVSTWDGATWQATDTSYFIYDGWNLVAELDAHGQTEAAYVWGLDLSQSLQGAGGVGGLLARVDAAAKTHFYSYDGNGNVGQLIDAADGSLAAAYEYDPYGNTVKAVGDYAEVNPFRFSTKYLDAESGFYYYGYRYYVPELGRWVNRDPIEEEGGVNLYNFTQNNPSDFVDPLGRALYAFDGTGTNYDTWTHVSMLHRSYRSLNKEYEEGVGSSAGTKVFGGAFGAGGRRRLESMYRKFLKIYSTDDSDAKDIDIIGFSRGAALAREFANMLHARGYHPGYYANLVEWDDVPDDYSSKGCPVTIRFVGLFDTVGSFGIPGNQVNLGIRMDLPPNVEHAAHAIARDERRSQFPLTRLNAAGPGQTFNEESFPGDHSDIGGGHEKNANILSLSPLLYIWGQGRSVGVPFGDLPFTDRLYKFGAYQQSFVPHDLTPSWIYTDGGVRENLP